MEIRNLKFYEPFMQRRTKDMDYNKHFYLRDEVARAMNVAMLQAELRVFEQFRVGIDIVEDALKHQIVHRGRATPLEDLKDQWDDHVVSTGRPKNPAAYSALEQAVAQVSYHPPRDCVYLQHLLNPCFTVLSLTLLVHLGIAQQNQRDQRHQPQATHKTSHRVWG